MISLEHLSHWINEMNYQLRGLLNELNKPEFKKINSIPVGDSVFSFEYAREKSETIQRLLNSVFYDMRHDEDNG